MKTIRTKVYQFSELSKDLQAVVIVNEAIRFNLFFTGRQRKEFNHHELDAAKERILKYKYDFTKDGKLFHS